MCYEISFAQDLPSGRNMDEEWGYEEVMNFNHWLGLALYEHKEHYVTYDDNDHKI